MKRGIRAANYIYGSAPKDGTAIGIFRHDTPMLPLMGAKGHNSTHNSSGRDRSTCRLIAHLGRNGSQRGYPARIGNLCLIYLLRVTKC
jgi:hypothetical protein